MNKLDRLVVATILSFFIGGVVLVGWGIISILATLSLRDILTVVGVIVASLGFIGIVYWAIGRWWN